MLTLKVLSVLLSYPNEDTLAALDDMAGVIANEGLLLPNNNTAVLALINRFRQTELLDLQEQYVDQFDRGRYLSLHIFEHVHGESRDRGQAMVNLLQMYESHGFELDSNELPDYIPLFLEFLAQQKTAICASLLRDAMPVLSLLSARLNERNSDFAAIFQALEGFAGEPEGIDDIRQQAATETEDETLLHMDAIWEEEAVSFMGAADTTCQSQKPISNPVTVMPREQFMHLKSSTPLPNPSL
jgi:nitrate reductase molybdenum cofactor assembly chaperone NarJ/NarW